MMHGRDKRVKKLAKVLLAAVLGLVLIVAGCSSDSSKSSDTAAYSGGSKSSPGSTASNQMNTADSGAGTGFDPTAASANRMVVYNAYVTIEVKDFAAAQAEIRNLVQLSGGYLLEFSENRREDGTNGSLVIKVPSSGFMNFLERLEELAPDNFRSHISGEDVTEEYVDLDARLQALEVAEGRLLAFMEKSTTAGELVEFSRELSNVQQEIERIKGRMRYLEQNVAYSTIEVRINEQEDGISRIQGKRSPFVERLSDSFYAVMIGISNFLQDLVIFVITAIPVVVLIGVFALPFFLLWRRYRKKKRKDEEEWAARLQTPRSAQEQNAQVGQSDDHSDDHTASRATGEQADPQDERNRSDDKE
jgi:hypothetical protein